MSLPDFLLERFFGKYEFEAPHLLCASDCESMSIGDLLEFTGVSPNELSDVWLGYTETRGHTELREAIARLYSTRKHEDVLVAAPQEAIFLTMMSLLEPGDRVVVQTPCYQSLFEIARFRGCDVQTVPMNDDQGTWTLDLDRLKEALVPKTKLLILNSPHNPTGYLPSKDTFDDILAMARQNGTYFFHDEMYRGLEYEPRDRLPSACDVYERAIVLSGLSKTYGLPGLRLGWLITADASFLDRCEKTKDYTTICAPGPTEFLGRIALQHHERLRERSLDQVLQNLDLLRGAMTKWSGVLEWREPRAGSLAFCRLRGESADVFCREAREKSGVLLASSTLFDFGDRHVRWGLGRKNFSSALTVMDQHLRRDGRLSTMEGH